MKNIVTNGLVVFSFLIACNLFGQTPANVTWSLALPDSQKVSSISGNLSGLSQTSSPGFVVRDYANGPGPDQRWWPYDNGAAVAWGAETTQVATRWVQFAVYPNASFNFHADNISIYLGGKGTDGIRANIVYSLDESFTTATQVNDSTLVLKKDSDSLYSFNINADVLNGEMLYVRVYPWYVGASSTSKYLYMRNAAISGSIKALTYPASATWEMTDPGTNGTGLAVATTGQVTALDELPNNLVINQYTGPGQSQRLKMNAWTANQTTRIDSVFIQFAVSPKAGFKFTATGISLGIAAASINTMKAELYYSTDSTFQQETKIDYKTLDSVNNYLAIDALLPIAAAINEPVNTGESFYFRIYPWVDNDPAMRTGKYVCVQNVVISGEIEGKPTAASAVWPFETDDAAVTTGSVNAQNQSYSSAMMFYTSQFPVLPSTDGSGDHTCGAIQTVSKVWNAEPNSVDSMYFQYAVSPKHGGTFFADSLSMYIGGWYTDKLKAAVYYSKDASFITKTMLIADTALVGNFVMPLKAVFAETVNTDETLFIRVYPHNTEVQGWAKLVAVDSVCIYGTTVGVTADPPTVTTAAVKDISTTFAISGGNISSDGGSAVTERGVVWNISGNPTIADPKTSDGEGSGSFVSKITGLTNGTTYYLRAFAANEAGTSYGYELTFKTLDSTEVPMVSTTPASVILVKSATAGGEVTAWGGDTVTVRGVCWNAIGNPTIQDSKTENGSGLGKFSSTLYPLESKTTYYFRAYAANSVGTGYGAVDSFTTQQPAPNIVKVVAKDGSGDYSTVQAAFDAVPDFYTGQYKIFVKKGTYYEKLTLTRNKVNVLLQGEDPDSTILTYDDYAGKAGGTSNSQSVAIDADDFTAINIVFQNTVVNDGSVPDQQGVALRVNGDRQAYYNCKLRGYQDTYYTWGGRTIGRTYMKNCFIEGSVDFIFGRNVVLFDSCEIHINRTGGTLTAASTEADTKFGYVFVDCKITSDSIGFDGKEIVKFFLGRPWQSAPRTVFIKCEEPANLDPAGWMTWNVTPGLYAEYNCFGSGSSTTNRLSSISRQLTDTEAADYTISNIFAKTTNPGFGYDWLPIEPVISSVEKDLFSVIPVEYALSQNYPNPFNPATTIRYALPKNSLVKINIYNALGEQVVNLVNLEQAAGNYEVQFNASRLASGIYFYNIKAGDFIQTRKMLLLK